MLLLNQIAKLPMAGRLLPRRLDFGIEKLKAGSPVRLEQSPLLPLAASAMTTTLAPCGGFFFNYISSLLMTVSPSQTYNRNLPVTFDVHFDCKHFLSFSQAKNLGYFTPFDLFLANFP